MDVVGQHLLHAVAHHLGEVEGGGEGGEHVLGADES